jgi:hypothetical protein
VLSTTSLYVINFLPAGTRLIRTVVTCSIPSEEGDNVQANLLQYPTAFISTSSYDAQKANQCTRKGRQTAEINTSKQNKNIRIEAEVAKTRVERWKQENFHDKNINYICFYFNIKNLLTLLEKKGLR